jgi:hypothetical protein
MLHLDGDVCDVLRGHEWRRKPWPYVRPGRRVNPMFMLRRLVASIVAYQFNQLLSGP